MRPSVLNAMPIGFAGQIHCRVGSKEVIRFQHKARVFHRHDRKVFRPANIADTEAVPNHDVLIFNRPVLLHPLRQAIASCMLVGIVPGVFTTAAFVLPPFARAVALGLDQVPREVLEAGKAVGLTPCELICKSKLPLAAPYLVTGLHRCIMMSLSMVVILTNHQTAVAIDSHTDILKDRSNGRLGLMNGHFGRTYAWECG